MKLDVFVNFIYRNSFHIFSLLFEFELNTSNYFVCMHFFIKTLNFLDVLSIFDWKS